MKYWVSLLLAVLVGCASSGRIMQPDKLSAIKPGGTTKSELVSWFGTPAFQSLDANGKSVMNWHYVRAQSYGFVTDVKTQQLSVLLGTNDVVERFTLTDQVNAPAIVK